MRESNHAFVERRRYIFAGMLLLAAFTRLLPPREEGPNDLLAQRHAALGHLGLIIIAVVIVVLTFWKS